MNSSHKRRPRHGFTLVELAIAVTTGAMVMGIATAMLVALVRTNRDVGDRLEQIAVRDHLSNRFRSDVAGATACIPLDEKQPQAGIVLKAGEEGSVRYLAGNNDVERIAMTGDHVDARETFFLGDSERATLTLSADSPVLVCCSIEQVAAPAEAEKPLMAAKPHPALVIAAALGRSDRLAQAVQQAARPPKVEVNPVPAAETPAAAPPAAESPTTPPPPANDRPAAKSAESESPQP